MDIHTNTSINKSQYNTLRRVIWVFCIILALTWPIANAQGAPDRFEVDDTPEIATEILIGRDPIRPEDIRNFHSPDDADWIIFFAPQDSEGNNTFTIRVQAEPSGGNATNIVPVFTVFDQTGVNACAQDSTAVKPEDTCLIDGENFTPFIEGYYFIKLVNSSADHFDDETAYTIRIGGVSGDQIYGYVRDAVTRELLPGATIAIQGTQLSAQSIGSPKTGFYLILIQSANAVSVTASRPGYKPFLKENIGIDIDSVKLDIDLVPEVSIDLLIAFVTRFYRLILQREADPKGLGDWTTGLRNGSKTGAELAHGFIFSNEFIGRNTIDTKFLTILYLAFFDRKPDTRGYNLWLDDMRAGMDREEVLNGFLVSQEFARLAQKFGISPGNINTPGRNIIAFVTRFYRSILERDPDQKGLQDWVDQLSGGTRAGADIARDFIGSNEFVARDPVDEDYLHILYLAFFNRDPDPTGFKQKLDALQSGKTRDDVLDEFLISTEFAELAEKFGIRAK